MRTQFLKGQPGKLDGVNRPLTLPPTNCPEEPYFPNARWGRDVAELPKKLRPYYVLDAFHCRLSQFPSHRSLLDQKILALKIPLHS